MIKKSKQILYRSRYLFSGKEIQNGDAGNGEILGLYDFGARFYDPEIPRWLTLDPLAEDYDHISPYTYCLNSPLNYIDPDGRAVRVSPALMLLMFNAAPQGANETYQVDDFGYIMPSSIEAVMAKQPSLFLQDLHTLSLSPMSINVSISGCYKYKDNEGNIQETIFEKVTDYDTKEHPGAHDEAMKLGYAVGLGPQGIAGRVLFPGNNSNTEKNSLDDEIQVIINGKGSVVHQVLGLVEEFAHTQLYLEGMPHQDFLPDVDLFIAFRLSPFAVRYGYDRVGRY